MSVCVLIDFVVDVVIDFLEASQGLPQIVVVGVDGLSVLQKVLEQQHILGETLDGLHQEGLQIEASEHVWVVLVTLQHEFIQLLHTNMMVAVRVILVSTGPIDPPGNSGNSHNKS